jgi:predicted nuclease of predicted toxin-antitoxin system
MKLLFDQNLSFKLCSRMADLFPGSAQVRSLGLDQAEDREIWQYAEKHGFILVSQDSDFADLAMLLGTPPKIIWLRSGNQSTAAIEHLLRNHAEAIISFEQNDESACLEIL